MYEVWRDTSSRKILLLYRLAKNGSRTRTDGWAGRWGGREGEGLCGHKFMIITIFIRIQLKVFTRSSQQATTKKQVQYQLENYLTVTFVLISK